MFPKSSRYNGKYILGMFLFTVGLFLQSLWPSHSLYYHISFVLIIAGLAYCIFGTYLFVPLLLLTASAIVDLIPQFSHEVKHTVNLVIMALAVAVGLWGWWWERQARAMQTKIRFENKLN